MKAFTGYSLQLFITIVTSIIDLVSFSFILYSIYPQLFGAIIIYSAFGTLTTAWLGKSLVKLNFQQLQREAGMCDGGDEATQMLTSWFHFGLG